MNINDLYNYLLSKPDKLHLHSYDTNIIFEHDNMHIDFNADFSSFELTVYAKDSFSVIATSKTSNLDYLIKFSMFIVDKIVGFNAKTIKEYSLDKYKNEFNAIK